MYRKVLIATAAVLAGAALIVSCAVVIESLGQPRYVGSCPSDWPKEECPK